MNASTPVPPPPMMPSSEIDHRVRRLREAMKRHKLDVVVLTSRQNIEYFSGLITLLWPSSSRPNFMMITQDDHCLVGSRIEERNILLAPRPFRTVIYDGFLPQGTAALAAEYERTDPSSSATVGVDYGLDLYGRGSIELLDRLTGQGRRERLVEAAEAIWEVRRVKSPLEAHLKRTALAIANQSFDGALREAYEGITEIEFFRSIFSQLGANGAERTETFPVLFGRTPFVYNRPASERKLTRGDYIWVDFRGATYGGYPADRNRIARAGTPEDWEIAAYGKVRTLTVELARNIRPGMTCNSVYAQFEDLWRAADVGPLYARASRVGHGGGLDLTEPPSVMRNSSEVIEAGMIIHVEPKLELRGGVFQFEEVIYVTETDNEFLSELSPERLPVIACREDAA